VSCHHWQALIFNDGRQGKREREREREIEEERDLDGEMERERSRVRDKGTKRMDKKDVLKRVFKIKTNRKFEAKKVSCHF
jgi:hypothetical protein